MTRDRFNVCLDHSSAVQQTTTSIMAGLLSTSVLIDAFGIHWLSVGLPEERH